MHATYPYRKLAFCLVLLFISIAFSQSCADGAQGCQTCKPASCSSGCCVDGQCAKKSSDCQISMQTFLLICLPFACIICLTAIALCVRIVRKSLAQRRDARLPEIRNFTQVQVFQIAQGQPIQFQNNDQPVESPLRLLVARGRTKIAPINTVQIEAGTPAAFQTAISPYGVVSAGIEVNHQEFQKTIVESSGSALLRKTIMNAPQGTSLNAEDRVEQALDSDVRVVTIQESEE